MPRASPQIHDAHVRPLGGAPSPGGQFVLSRMQQSQRAAANHALQRANALGVPVRVGFGLTVWPERPVSGTVRSMTAGGLERKSDIHAHVAGVGRRVAEAQQAGVFAGSG